MTKRRLLIVAHAPSPNTRRLFDAVVEEARSDENQNVEVVALIPTCIDQNPCAHLRRPMDMIFHG